MIKAKLLNTRVGLVTLMAGIFAINYFETQMENAWKSGAEYEKGYNIAKAFHGLEGYFSFNYHELASYWVIAGYSFSYFILFPMMLLGLTLSFALKESISPFRVFTLALTINYALCLPFFLFFPVPERWAFPDANAVLLTDIISTYLIEAIRPISALDNSFPSVHVSFTAVMLYLSYQLKLKYRNAIFFLGMTIMLSTFILGIHWIADIVVGTMVGLLSGSMAVLAERKLTKRFEPALAKVKKPATYKQKFKKILPIQDWVKLSFWKRLGKFKEFLFNKTKIQIKTKRKRKSAFISYRREKGSKMARIVQGEIEKRNYSVFLDVDDLGPEQFDSKLLKEIESAPNFILILAPGSLDRCVSKDDWLRREIAHAIKTERNIIPMMFDGFQYPPKEFFPEDIHELIRHNGVIYSHDYHEATFNKLMGFLRKK